MPEQKRTFQNRARRVKDDGADFEEFVFECFRVAMEESGFARRLGRGRDGAIDLIDRFAEPGAATVAECKYIGSGSSDEAAARWREVASNLKKHLPALYRDPVKAPRSPYRGWLDPQRPVTRYRFCVTVAMLDPELRELERRIQADFQVLVQAGVEPLRALAENADGNVRVLRWDWFAAQLNQHPSLAFRWFRGLPAGVELFANRRGTETTFRDFLESGELRYFSRDQYEGQGIGTLQRGEADLVTGLSRGEPKALLITGPGGVGKTRLSLELASVLASSGHGFDVYRLGRSAGFGSVIELAGRYPGDASILLLIDYAEAAPELSKIADAVAHLTENTRHDVRVVATCRASANTLVRYNLAVLDPEEKSLGSSQTGEEAYVQWVARSILALEAFPEAGQLERICDGIPALATFALFLFRCHRDQFDVQFGALHGLDDFDKWVSRRISNLISNLGGRRATERALAHIALALPLPLERFKALEEQGDSLLDALRVDRWIELSDGLYHAAHDVLADALAARWLFEADHAATDHTVEILDEAAQFEDLAHVLVALDRLAQHSKFGEIDGATVVRTLIARHPKQIENCCSLLLGGALLDFEDKLELLSRSELIREAAKRERAVDVNLGRLASGAVHRKLSLDTLPALRTLSDLLDHACDQPQYSNMVLRHAYALDPDRFRDRAFENLFVYPIAEQTHFLLVQMLRSGEPTESLERHVIQWIAHNATTFRASFVYRAWLERAECLGDTIRGSVLAWIAEHGSKAEARFVYRAWFAAGGPLGAIAERLVSWFSEHGQRSDAGTFYEAWLVGGRELDPIRQYALCWILKWPDHPAFVNVIKPICKLHDLPEAVTLAIAHWCATCKDPNNALDRLSTLSGHTHDHMISAGGIITFLRYVEDVVDNYINRDDLSGWDKGLLWKVCASVASNELFHYNPFAALRIISKVVSTGIVFNNDLQSDQAGFLSGSYVTLANIVSLATRLGFIDTSRDVDGLQQFNNWIEINTPEILEETETKPSGRSEVRMDSNFELVFDAGERSEEFLRAAHLWCLGHINEMNTKEAFEASFLLPKLWNASSCFDDEVRMVAEQVKAGIVPSANWLIALLKTFEVRSYLRDDNVLVSALERLKEMGTNDAQWPAIWVTLYRQSSALVDLEEMGLAWLSERRTFSHRAWPSVWLELLGHGATEEIGIEWLSATSYHGKWYEIWDHIWATADSRNVLCEVGSDWVRSMNARGRRVEEVEQVVAKLESIGYSIEPDPL